ncbi:hypothetical protein [Hymenobacter oligotrophus]|uniref:hypothetical protein n=1 Tax=Hymenobacter oligotrophus TaxID=2319843 RepID=UPI0013C31634|nr:hypothetical protein [Hymenobacter oligotrophus]
MKRSEKRFVNGIYYFTHSSHDSGRLFIHHKGQIIFLRNDNTSNILTDYSSYLKKYAPSENTRIAYLSAIAAFMKFRSEDQRLLIKSGALETVN